MASGVVALSALVGTQYDGGYDISTPLVKWSGMIQWATFGLGVISFCFFALGNLEARGESEVDALRSAMGAHQRLGYLSEQAGDVASARRHYEEVVQLKRRAGV
jgi:hypothetical protein